MPYLTVVKPVRNITQLQPPSEPNDDCTEEKTLTHQLQPGVQLKPFVMVEVFAYGPAFEPRADHCWAFAEVEANAIKRQHTLVF